MTSLSLLAGRTVSVGSDVINRLGLKFSFKFFQPYHNVQLSYYTIPGQAALRAVFSHWWKYLNQQLEEREWSLCKHVARFELGTHHPSIAVHTDCVQQTCKENFWTHHPSIAVHTDFQENSQTHIPLFFLVHTDCAKRICQENSIPLQK